MTIMPDTLKKGTYLWHKDSFFSVIKKKLQVQLKKEKALLKTTFCLKIAP